MEKTSQHCAGLIAGAWEREVAEIHALQADDQIFILAQRLVSFLTLGMLLNSLNFAALVTRGQKQQLSQMHMVST